MTIPSLPKTTRGCILFLAAFGLIFCIAGTWILPLIDRDEPRFAEAAREMIEGNDYTVPYFNGQFRFDKPPLIYWLQAPFYRIFGQNEFAARLPSVLAATLTGLLIFGFGLRISDRQTAMVAAMVFITCLQTMIHAKAAVADFAMVLFFTLSVWSAWEMVRSDVDKPRRFWWWIFYSSLGLGFLAKGPLAWLPLLGLGIFLWQRKRANSTHPPARLDLVPGLILMLGIVAAWGIPALRATGGDYFQIGIGKHVVARSLTSMEGHGAKNLLTYVVTLPFYFALVFFSFFPWSLKLPWLVRNLRANRNFPAEIRFLLIQIAVVFVVFTLVKTKLPHYTLPAFPLLALVLAIQWKKFDWDNGLRWSKKVMAGMFALNLLISLVIFPLVRPIFIAPALAEKSREMVTSEMPFASDGYNEPSLVWYFRSQTRGFMAQMSEDFMQRPGARFCVVKAADLPKWFPNGTGDLTVLTVKGMNFTKFQPLEVAMVIKQD